MGTLNNTCALVTGAGRGLGRAIALSLAEAGAKVILVARSGEELSSVAAEVEQVGGEAESYPGDLLDAAFVEDLREMLASSGATVDILVNNAGIAPSAPLSKTDSGTFQRCMDLNVKAPFLLSQAFAPGMKAKGWGRIINVASTAALKGYAYTSAYVASKHALLGLTRALATELLRDGITVNAVCPGFADTQIADTAIQNIVDKTDRSADEARAALLKGEGTLGRLIRPEEVAQAVMTFCGPHSDAMTGIALPVAGDAV